MSTTGEPTKAINPELREAICALFDRYPTRQAVTLPALHLIQQSLGRVPAAGVVELAELLELAPAQVQDTLTFYGFFKQSEPLGRVRVWVCRSLSCSARGGEDLLEYLCEKLGIRPGQTTPDGRVTLEVADCLGLCEGAPAMLAGDTVYTELTREKIDQFVQSLEDGKSPGGAQTQ